MIEKKKGAKTPIFPYTDSYEWKYLTFSVIEFLYIIDEVVFAEDIQDRFAVELFCNQDGGGRGFD